MTTLFSPIREFFKKGDVLLLFLCLTASGYGLALIYSATRYLATVSYTHLDVSKRQGVHT